MQVEAKVGELLLEDKLDAIVCVAGGWAGGNAASAGMSLHVCVHAHNFACGCRLGEEL